MSNGSLAAGDPKDGWQTASTAKDEELHQRTPHKRRRVSRTRSHHATDDEDRRTVPGSATNQGSMSRRRLFKRWRSNPSLTKYGAVIFSMLAFLIALQSDLLVDMSSNLRVLRLGQPCGQTYDCRASSQSRRVVHYVYHDDEQIAVTDRHTPGVSSSTQILLTPQRLVEPMGNLRRQQKIQNTKDYVEDVDVVETDDCTLRYEWQKSSRPTCNILHEFDMGSPSTHHHANNNNGKVGNKYRIIGNGYWRDVWVAHSNNNNNGALPVDDEKVVFKSMRYEHDFTLRNFDRMRRDAAVMDRLAFSDYIIDLFAFCGTSSFSEHGDGGDILTHLEKGLTQLERLQIATQISTALADLHNADHEGQASIAHTDIAPGQFIKVGDHFKLNDFNRARFLAWSTSKQKPCPYHVANNGGKFRSPEEYLGEPQTEMVDVYSLGNILYMLLQEEWPFGNVKTAAAIETVRNGGRPSIYSDIWNSTDPATVLIKKAMIHCHEQEPEDRWTARQVEQFLNRGLKDLDHEQYETRS